MFGILCVKYSFFKSYNLTASPFTLQNFIMSDISRNDEWNSDRPQEERKYDGPAGMDPDGVIDSNWDEVCENFDDMNLKEELLRGIYAYGFEKPSAIQQRAIVPCIKGMDVIAQAQSGTGKTATFSIAILQKIDTSTSWWAPPGVSTT